MILATAPAEFFSVSMSTTVPSARVPNFVLSTPASVGFLFCACADVVIRTPDAISMRHVILVTILGIIVAAVCMSLSLFCRLRILTILQLPHLTIRRSAAFGQGAGRQLLYHRGHRGTQGRPSGRQ